MNTRALLVVTSLFLGSAGLAASFAPDDVLGLLHIPATGPLPVLVQLGGALYLAWAFANWTAKDSLIGGIYARPLSLGNCLHFLMGALALGMHQYGHGFQNALTALLSAYVLLALAYLYLVFGQGAACAVQPAPDRPDSPSDNPKP